MELWRDLLVLVGGGLVGYLGILCKSVSKEQMLLKEIPEPYCIIEGYGHSEKDENGETSFYLKRVSPSLGEDDVPERTKLTSVSQFSICDNLQKELQNDEPLIPQLEDKKLFVFGEEINDTISTLRIGDSKEDIMARFEIDTMMAESLSVVLCSSSVLLAFFSNTYITKRKVLHIAPFKITIRNFKDFFTSVLEITVQCKDKVYSQSPLLYHDRAHNVLIENGIISDSEYANEEIIDKNKLTLRYFAPRSWSRKQLIIRRIVQIFSIGGITLAMFSLLDSFEFWRSLVNAGELNNI